MQLACIFAVLLLSVNQAFAVQGNETAFEPQDETAVPVPQDDTSNVGIWDPKEYWPAGGLDCVQGFRQFNELTQKKTYNIGIYAPDNIDTTVREFNLTFETYLTETVGKRWNPPIEFKMVPTRYPLIAWIDQDQDVDMMYADSGFFSCTGTEIGAQPLGTTLSRTKVRGRYYDLDVLGGTMLVSAVSLK